MLVFNYMLSLPHTYQSWCVYCLVILILLLHKLWNEPHFCDWPLWHSSLFSHIFTFCRCVTAVNRRLQQGLRGSPMRNSTGMLVRIASTAPTARRPWSTNHSFLNRITSSARYSVNANCCHRNRIQWQS